MTSTHVPGRRLPVYFLIDDSAAMAGTYQSAIPEGLETLRHQLSYHPLAVRNVYLSVVYYGEQVVVHHLQPLSRFTLTPMRARGTRPLQKALSCLQESMMYDGISASADQRGDARSLLFIIMGDVPDTGWQKHVADLTRDTQNHAPFIVTLLRVPDLKDGVAAMPYNVLLTLDHAQGNTMPAYFTWAMQMIIAVCEAEQQAGSAVTLPLLSAGIRQLP